MQVIKRNLLGAKEELEAKLSKVEQVDNQLDVAEVGITRRRTKMISLQERSDTKIEKLRRAKLQLAMLDENNKRNSFNEDLEDFEIVETPPKIKIEDRSNLGFADILKLSKNAPKTLSAPKQKEEVKTSSKPEKGYSGKYFTEFKLIKENLSEQQFQRREVETNVERCKKRIHNVAGKFVKERKRVSNIQEKLLKL